LDQRFDEVEDLRRARRLPSLQLVGSREKRNLDLGTLQAHGVELVGRLAGVRDGSALFSGSLANHAADADLKMSRLLDQIDAFAGGEGVRPDPVRVPSPRNVARWSEFSTVIWATGFRPHHPYLERDLLDQRGEIVHEGGVARRPGLYVIGLTFGRTRRSSFIDGAANDARAIIGHLVQTLRRTTTMKHARQAQPSLGCS
jgi:putative flavoprotein involved in K+ transport